LSSSLKAHAKSLGLNEVIRFAGHCGQEQVALEYSRHDTFILPSISEVWGLVVNEALASGLHVVVSNRAGVADFVKPMAGVFITEPTTNQIAKALEQSRTQWVRPISDPEILSYTPERFACAIKELIQQITSGRSRPSLTWLTNIPIPYRVQIWRALNSSMEFNLVTMTNQEKGRGWDLSNEMQDIKHTNMNSRPYSIKIETPLYLNVFKTNQTLKKIDSNAIYIDGYESPSFFLSALLEKRRHKTVIFGYRSTLASRRFNGFFIGKLRSWVFSLADYVVTAGSASTEAVIEIGVSPEKIVTLFNPVDVQWFADIANRNRVQASRGHRFLYVGKLI
jgi:glycosyltransferase involved in cell wall biosynthesis